MLFLELYAAFTLIALLVAFVCSMEIRDADAKLYFKRAVFWPLAVARALYWLLVEED